MSTKIITLPEKTLNIVDENRQPTGRTLNVFIDCLRSVNESVPHKNNTDITLVASIAEKIESVKESDKIFEMEDAEIEHITQGLKSLMDKGAIVGSKWIHLVQPLREAKPKPKSEKSK